MDSNPSPGHLQEQSETSETWSAASRRGVWNSDGKLQKIPKREDMYIYICIHNHIWYMFMHIYTYIYMHTHINIYIYIHTHRHGYSYIIYIHLIVCIYIYTYISLEPTWHLFWMVCLWFDGNLHNKSHLDSEPRLPESYWKEDLTTHLGEDRNMYICV